MLIERREDEDMTSFTMRRVRADILEQAAKVVEKTGSERSDLECAACRVAAYRIRKMAEE